MDNRLGAILLREGEITEEQRAFALQEQEKVQKNTTLGEVLVNLKFVSCETAAKALSKQLSISYSELGDDFKIEIEAIRLIPESVARRCNLIPVKRENGSVVIAMKDPLDLEAINTVQASTSLEVRRIISTEKEIQKLINKYYKEEAYIERNLQDIINLEIENGTASKKKERIDSGQLRILANDAPVVRFVNLLLFQAVRDMASDIHFEPSEYDVAVRLRVDGILRKTTPPPKSLYQGVITRIKILAGMDIAEKRLPQDGRFKIKIDNRPIDIRVSSLPEVCGEKIVLRLLDRKALITEMKDIGLEPDMLERFQKILKRPHGIILLTGPTGSGKTTTLYSALNFLKSTTRNIQTVEDPVEYLIEGINQMQIKPAINLNFSNALRSILRQDPDIIMIGEIRDLETARMAMRASLTGHLVLSTLHTNDAPSAISRLKDIGVDLYLIAATLNLVISQRLARIICEKCKEEITPSIERLKLVKTFYPDADKWKYYQGRGCKECFQTGYKGRIAIFEFFEINELIRKLAVEGKEETYFKSKAAELGLVFLMTDGFLKVRQGITTIEEILSICPYLENF